MNVATLLGVGIPLVGVLVGFIPIRHSIRTDRAEGAERQRQAELDAADRQEAAVRRAVADAKEPLMSEIENLRVERRDLNKRINDLIDERARGWQRGP